jgi:hypothetical protein
MYRRYAVTIEQTVEIPASRRLTIEVPPEVPVGRTILAFRPAGAEPGETAEAEAEAALAAGKPCPLCAKHADPVTGEKRLSAATIAAIEEVEAMERGEIPSPTFHSLEELLADLRS